MRVVRDHGDLGRKRDSGSLQKKQSSECFSDRGATLKAGGGGGLTSDSKWEEGVGAENTFFSVTSAGLVSWNAENCSRDISKSVYTCTSNEK